MGPSIWTPVDHGISWTGGTPTYRAHGCWVMYGPRFERMCFTKTGARILAWRLRRKAAR